MSRASVVFLILCLICLNDLTGQSRMEVNYTMEDGLPSNFVYRAVQDSAGYIWFCTDKGVSKFDGTSFRTFDVSDGLPHNDIFDIGMDNHGKLWLSTFDSICYIKNDSIHYLRTTAPRFDSPVIHKFSHQNSHFIELRNGNRTMFFENNDVLTKIDPLLFKGQPLTIDSVDNFTLIERHSLKKHYIHHYKENELIYSNRIHSTKSIFAYGQILIESNHYLFESDTVYVWTGENLLKHAYHDLWGINPQIYGVKQFNGNIIIQGYKQKLVVDKNLEVTDSLNYLLQKDFNSFIQDSEGNVWLCTNNGVSYISNNDNSSTKYNIPNEEDNFIQLVKDKDKNIYIATKAGKLFKLEEGGNLRLIKDFETEKIKDISFYEEKNTLFYFDLDKGIFSFDLNSPHILNTYNKINDQMNSGGVKSIDISEAGDILLSKSHGVDVYRGQEKKKITARRSYASIFSGDDIFFGTMSGLFTYSEDSLLKISDENFSYVVQNLFTDKKGGLWIVPNNEGLWKYQDSSIINVSEVGELYVNNMTQDAHGVIWLASTKGLYKLNEEAKDNYSISRYGNSYGIIEDNIVDVSYSNDYIFALTKKHLYKFRNSKTQITKNSQFHYTETYVNGMARAPEQIQKLNHQENNIEIQFNTRSFSDLGDFTYRWKLLPTNQDWQETNESSLLFNSLSPGDYSLLIDVEDSEGNILHENQELTFSIKKPWYGTNLFYFICGCLLLLISYVVNKRMQYVQRKKSDAEYEIQKQFYELRLKAVQAQMNPHFLFNALNSIQRFIYQKSPEEANKYIVKFARLMRLILESTSKNYSSLKEEIQLLENYISLEQLRFADSFDFHLDLGKDIIPEDIKIPSTILQPFVENSINHGLANKNEHGNIWIRFNIQNMNLICEIEDDGIGRDSAKKYRKSNHKSRALEIIHERKEVLLKRDNFDFDFHYNDLVSDEGKVVGTMLILTIPINDEK